MRDIKQTHAKKRVFFTILGKNGTSWCQHFVILNNSLPQLTVRSLIAANLGRVLLPLALKQNKARFV